MTYHVFIKSLLQANLSAAGILTAVSATRQAQVDAASGTWDGEVLVVSKHAESLKQNPNPPAIPSSGWKCQNCDLTANIWLNLTDGAILCGRKNFDGSGGNNHAVDHFQQGKGGGPLAVKLGTITKARMYTVPYSPSFFWGGGKGKGKQYHLPYDI